MASVTSGQGRRNQQVGMAGEMTFWCHFLSIGVPWFGGGDNLLSVFVTSGRDFTLSDRFRQAAKNH
jgi:hypothetical protein